MLPTIYQTLGFLIYLLAHICLRSATFAGMESIGDLLPDFLLLFKKPMDGGLFIASYDLTKILKTYIVSHDITRINDNKLFVLGD